MRFEKLFHLTRVLTAAVFLLVLYTLQVYAQAGGGEASSKLVSDEPQIFARVLKESLDAAGLGEFLPGPFGVRSPIETGIQADFIPTVGLLVRVPVSFPISAPTTDPAPDAPTTESKDLWEKYSSAGSHGERDRRVVKLRADLKVPRPASLDPDILVHREEVEIDGPKNIHISGNYDEDEAGRFFVERIAPKFNIMLGGFTSVPYEEARVAKLRDTILDVLAQYGHRVSSLQEGERVIVIVEAPVSGGRTKVVVGDGNELMLEESAPFHARLDGKEERMLIAVPKSAVASASTREAIASQVTEKRY